MSIKEFILKRIVSHFKMNEAYSFFELMRRVGQPSSVDVPPDLLPMAGKMFARAGANQLVFQISRDWVLPYWAFRQYTPGDVSFVPRMGWASFNLTHRNWTAVGNFGSDREVTIDPRGLVTPWFEQWSVDFWLVVDDVPHFPSMVPKENITQRALHNLPIIETVMTVDDVRLTTEAFGSSLQKHESVMMRAKIENLSSEQRNVRLIVSLRPYNPEGVAMIKSIQFNDDSIFEIDGKIGLLCEEDPHGVFCCDFRTGDCSHFINAFKNEKVAQCDVGLATAFADYRFVMEPDQVEQKTFAAPVRPIKVKKRTVKRILQYDVDDLKTTAVVQWRNKAKEGFTLHVPDKNVQEAFDLNKCYLNLFDDGASITPGVSTYHHYWFRDSAYMVAALDAMGYHDQAEEKLKNYPGRQTSDGFFLSQDGEWDSNGQAMWTLVEHYRMTGNREFLSKMFGSIEKGAHWINKKTEETKADKSPHCGLLPAGFSAEHFGPNDYFYWDDFWALAGLRDASLAAQTLGYRQQQITFQKYFHDLNQDVRASLRCVENRLGLPIMPASPYRRFDAGAIGCTCVIHPLKIMDPENPLVTNTFDALRDRCFYKQGFFQDMIHSGVNGYLSLHVAQGYAARHDPFAWEIAQYILSLATEAITWPEAININTGGGSMGDGMHGWAAADFLLFVRNTLLNEDENELRITPCVPDSWYEWGRRIEVNDAPTHFGPVSFKTSAGSDKIVLNIDAAWRNRPDKIVWFAPFEPKSFTTDGEPADLTEGRIEFSPDVKEVRIRISH